MTSKLYSRTITKHITKFLSVPEAIVILGARQVGKTTLLKLIQKEINSPKRVFYFDLEDTRSLEVLNSGVEEFIQYLKSSGANLSTTNYIFVDEIHYLTDPSKFIKLIVDHHNDKFKLIVTGSSSLSVKMKFKDSLVGRKLVFHLYPLTFREFLVFKERQDLANLLPYEPFDQKDDPGRFFFQDYARYFQEFLIFGGYPRVALEDEVDKKTKILGEIVNSYIYKDVRSLFQLEDIAKFNQLVKILAYQSGNLLNILNLSKTIGISRQTLSNYLTILENTYTLSLLPPYFTNKRKEIIKSPKVYFLDTGLRNYSLGNLNLSSLREDMGRLLECCVYTGLLKNKEETENINFWRTKTGTEVDFVLKKKGKLIPVEVKSIGKPHRGLLSFMQRYNVERGYIFHKDKFKMEKNITFLPLWWAG